MLNVEYKIIEISFTMEDVIALALKYEIEPTEAANRVYNWAKSIEEACSGHIWESLENVVQYNSP